MRGLLHRLRIGSRAEEGQTIVEYGLILTFIAIVTVSVLGSLGTSVVNHFTSAAAGF